ncbi:hypothetical protein Salmuc_03775 [Salipiger mucosus DSM 16094]|uniref:Uncharacterized protein n=1 Tax=Salipiger mucosus DSM 16094 TaxID=1123237 RepID=S9S2Q1_9RHOB|nr:hypothetical protein Salmuc_03775 [Salipiger mucosus DSM 16094]
MEDADLVAFDEAVASVGCDLVSESDYLPVEFQTGMTRPMLQEIAGYRIATDKGVRLESGGFRLTSGPCAPTAPATEPAALPSETPEAPEA